MNYNSWVIVVIVSLVSLFLLYPSSAYSMRRYKRPCFTVSFVSTTHVSFTGSNSKLSLSSEDNKIDLLYDSECPICALEVEFLKKRDIHSRIRFTDLSSADYNPAEHGNVQFADGMRKIRAVMPDKTVITGIEVFRQTYKAIGLGWIFDITQIPLIGKAADALYDMWAENRLRITGRGDLADVLKQKSQELAAAEPPVDCNSDACEVNLD